MIKIETKQLQEGAILAQPVITPLGQPLAPAGSAVIIPISKALGASFCISYSPYI